MNSDDMSVIYEMINRLGGVEKFQSNPYAFIGEVFKHPDLLSKIDKLSKTPEMQKQIQESMNNPMFQQMVGNNPLLAGMMNNYKAAHQNDDQAAQDVVDVEASNPENDENEELEGCAEENISVNGYDFQIPGWKAIDWLNPVSGAPFNIPDDPQKRVTFSAVLEEIPEECRERVEIIAEKRLQRHLNPLQLGQLDAMTEKYDGLVPLDLMVTLGGFIGEVCYCASLIMPDDDLCDLARFALAGVQRRSGFPVSSYLTQILLYLDSFDDIQESDWMNFIWSLSANPMTGRQGNFVATWEDASLIAEIAAEQLASEPEMFLGVCLGLLNWQELSLKGVDKPLQAMLAHFADKNAMKNLVLGCLGGKKMYGIALSSMSRAIKQEAMQYVISNDGLSTLLEKGVMWPSSSADLAYLLIDYLHKFWNSADATRRDAFILHAMHMENEKLARFALEAGVEWEREKYRLIALGSPFPSIQKWAEEL